MGAYVIVGITMIDEDIHKDYSAKALKSILDHGGKFLCKGPADLLDGSSPHTHRAVIEFPNKQTALSWYNSPAYQGIKGLRDASMNSTFQLVG